MRALSALFAVAVLAGCSGSSALTADALAGTTWSESCPDSDPELSYVRLQSDGQFAWSYDGPADVSVDGGDTWSVSGTTLTVSWNDGFATTAYDLSAGPDQLPGVSTKSCGDRAVLTRVP